MTTREGPRPARREGRVALAFAIALAGICLVVVAWSLPIDDFWLTLAAGNAIRAGADPFVPQPTTWLPIVPDAGNPQWLAQLVMTAFPGLGWPLAVNAALIGCGLLLTLLRMRRRASTPAVLVAGVVVVAALSPHLLARVQSFSFLLLAGLLLLLDDIGRRPWLSIVVLLLGAAWANLHGAFVVAQLVIGLSLAAAVFEAVRAQSPDNLARVAGCLLAAAAIIVGPVVNPTGIGIYPYAYGQGASGVVRAISVEWQPAWPVEPVALLFWAVVVLLAIGRWRRVARWAAADWLVVSGLGLLAAMSLRHIPWFLLASAPLLAGDVQSMLDRSAVVRQAVGRVAISDRGLIALGLVLALGATSVQLVRPAMPAAIARLTPDEPVALVDHLEALLGGGRARVLNEQVWGGYLAWRLGPGVTAAIDGRLEIHARETWQRYFDLMRGGGSLPDALRSAGVGWALLRADRSELRARLRELGWRDVTQAAGGILMAGPPGFGP